MSSRTTCFFDHELEGAKEDWAVKNSQLIQEMGVSDWLEQLLVALSTNLQDSPTYTVINPYKVILFSERLQGDHAPIVTHEMWVEANAKLIKEYGTEKWLWRLLDVLETGGPEASTT